MKINAQPLLLYIMYLNSAWKWDCDLILHQSPITRVTFKQYKRTRYSFRTNTTPVPYIHRTNADQCSVYIRGRDYDDFKLHWSLITSPDASTHAAMPQTYLLFVQSRPKWHPLHPTKINAEPSSPFQCIWTAREGEVTNPYCVEHAIVVYTKVAEITTSYCIEHQQHRTYSN